MQKKMEFYRGNTAKAKDNVVCYVILEVVLLCR